MISIIIPTYNSAATIVEAMESVSAQTLWADTELSVNSDSSLVNSTDNQQPITNNPTITYEVIVVDDCSQDNTVEVVQQWIKEKTLDPCEAPVVTGVSPVGSREGQDAAGDGGYYRRERGAPVVTGACPEHVEGVSPVGSREGQDAAGDGGY